MKIPEHFTNEEMQCRCGCGLLPDFDFMRRLYAMRLILNIPLVVISGARCAAYNASVGGRVGSTHLRGAADLLAISGSTRADIIQVGIAVGMTGIGFNRGSIHVDDKRGRFLMWDYYRS